MSTHITRPDPGRRLRLVNAEEARARGATEAQQLLAETFPANETRTPADALYTALVEFIALAHDNRFEELNERLKGFSDVIGPVLYRTQAPAVGPRALLGELQAAHTIIRNALAVMTTEQKTAWGELNERDQVAGEGITRANERDQVLAAASTASKRLSTRESNAAYGAGCIKGHHAAAEWFSHPHRGDPKRGGTLQYVMLDLAERMRNAQSDEEIKRTKGEIVGFCYRVECPADAIMCTENGPRP